MSNPTLEDIPSLSSISHEKNVKVVIYNTFSPIIISPTRHGVDVVIHNISKYISECADVITWEISGTVDMIYLFKKIKESLQRYCLERDNNSTVKIKRYKKVTKWI